MSLLLTSSLFLFWCKSFLINTLIIPVIVSFIFWGIRNTLLRFARLFGSPIAYKHTQKSSVEYIFYIYSYTGLRIVHIRYMNWQTDCYLQGGRANSGVSSSTAARGVCLNCRPF